SISFQDREYAIPRTHQFNLGFSYDLPWKGVLEVAYVGSRTRKYPVAQTLSAIPTAARIQGIANPAFLTAAVPNPVFGAPQLAGTSLAGATITQAQALNPFSQFSSVTKNGVPLGSSSYNGLEIRLNKRLSDGVSFTAAYTFSKTMEAASYEEPQYTT